jgi:hypothetical protein
MPRSRPLPRSLIPLPGESLPGFLLRLSCRLNQPPARISELTGLALDGPAGARLPLIHLAGIPEAARDEFTRMTRLTSDQVAGLGTGTWRERYGPVTATERNAPGGHRLNGQVVLAPTTRYCPDCLAGDGSAVQKSFGGTWLKTWHLPVVFACPAHQRLLEHLCPECGQAVRGRRPGGYTALLPAMRVAGLHPAQCRTEIVPSNGRSLPVCCGARLDHTRNHRPAATRMIALQDRILALLDPDGPAITLSAGLPASSAAYFADLRALQLLACSTWPAARNLSPSEEASAAIDQHVGSLRQQATDRQAASPATESRVRFDLLPADAAASGGLAHIAAGLLAGSTEEAREQLGPLLPAGTRQAGRSPWARLLARSAPSCSDGLRAAADPLLRGFTKAAGRPQGRRNAVLRPERWRPEHIPAFLEQAWFEDHLACLECGSTVKAARRIAAAALVQWTAGGSIGDAARYLGFNPGGGQYAPTKDLAQRLAALDPGRFNQALREIALRLDQAGSMVNYQHRRDLLRNWALTTREWNDITSRLPPAPGPFQPVLDDRKRQEASAFTWARVTQGEPQFAPRPIEASQPEPVQRQWTLHRANTWGKIASPGRFVHYAELRSLLIEHSDQLARDIDNGTDPNGDDCAFLDRRPAAIHSGASQIAI